ncbi:MAG: hypothetical protein PHV74_00290 [Dehalococcoidia bacterium]|nr:hypothetical protein [Dehalococcoidia bacterium]
MRDIRKSDVGKYVIIKPVCRWQTRKMRKKITHVFGRNGRNCIGVTYNGCRPFYVHHHEILSIEED